MICIWHLGVLFFFFVWSIICYFSLLPLVENWTSSADDMKGWSLKLLVLRCETEFWRGGGCENDRVELPQLFTKKKKKKVLHFISCHLRKAEYEKKVIHGHHHQGISNLYTITCNVYIKCAVGFVSPWRQNQPSVNVFISHVRWLSLQRCWEKLWLLWRTVLRVSLLLYPAGARTGGTHWNSPLRVHQRVGFLQNPPPCPRLLPGERLTTELHVKDANFSSHPVPCVWGEGYRI